ncbi:MAG: cell division protein FtsW [Rhodobiaceae bacterium]|jgi:cell division protein FtsW|nr:cell division protein FtsW [Rhodobiaceae bacterium]
MNLKRTNQNVISEWWWTIDRFLIALVFILIFCGVILNLAASPAVADRLGLDQYYFVKRHFIFLVPSIITMILCSFLNQKNIRRLCLLTFLSCILIMLYLNFFGTPIKGATRWLDLWVISLQPSEFAKPAFIVLISWFFSESLITNKPGKIISLILYIILISLLISQPDYGQTILITMVSILIYFIAGMPWIGILVVFIISIIGSAIAYLNVDHVAQRLNSYLNPSSGDTFQVDTAHNAIIKGGWLGKGPGEGTIKNILPDAHTDFIFAVAAEEYGIFICMLVVLLFAFIVLRGFQRAMLNQDIFSRLSIAGLSSMIGIQSGINIGVNLGIIPAKGMTLPFISYGGSSMLSIAIAFGFILAFSRKKASNRILFVNKYSRELN